MGRLLRNGDDVLLGHALFTGTPPGFRPADPDLDFCDVFGGPPRRSSAHEAGRGPADGGRGVGVEAGPSFGRPWSRSFGEEKPVFRGGGSPASGHQGQLGDDFFGDIFRGNSGSPCYSPRKMGRDSFASNPGSWVLSPARPMPPTSDVFSGGSSLPAKISFATKLAKGSDHLASSSLGSDAVYKSDKSIPSVFSFPSPIANAPANPSRLIHTKDDSKCDTDVSFNGSTIHRQTPHSQYRSFETTKLVFSEINDTGLQLKNNSSGLQAYSSSDYFHFSMHKWASIGVTLVMPYNLNERIKSGVSIQISPTEKLLPENQSVLQGHGAFLDQTDLEDMRRSDDLAAEKNHDTSLTKEVKEVLSAFPDTESIQSDITDALDNVGTCNKDGINISVGARKPELKNLRHLLSDCFDTEGDKEITGQIKNKESTVNDCTLKDANDTATLVQKTGENMFLSQTERAAQKTHDALATMEDKMLGRRVKGKVKEFIKVFNQETAPRSGSTVENQARKTKNRNKVKGRQEAYLGAHVAHTTESEKLKVDGIALSTPSVAGIQNPGTGEKLASDGCFNVKTVEDSSPEVKSISDTLSDSIQHTLDAPVCNIEVAYIENIGECLAEELPQNQNEVTEAALHQEEIQTSDSKIREWSRGKEGNIRSLLSTLQYILWPGSGWKPIPLVDIIEGASVRRAYQKALLCLHPDKLQQKGAKMHEKYIAERVFDILQEAWTEFNSVSSL